MHDPKDIVRDGYDKASFAYQDDRDGGNHPVYSRWILRLAQDLSPSAHVLDLGCGCGVPATRSLARLGTVVGVDISPVQIDRARILVPEAKFVCEDMSSVRFPTESFDAIVALYSIIHVPLKEQRDLLKRIADWLKPGGTFVATLGSETWTGTESDWLGVEGAETYWSHSDAQTYRAWLLDSGLQLIADEYVPEAGASGGHHLFYTTRRR